MRVLALLVLVVGFLLVWQGLPMGSLPEDECPAVQASSGASTSRSSASVWPSPSCACIRFACWPRSASSSPAVFFVGFDP